MRRDDLVRAQRQPSWLLPVLAAVIALLLAALAVATNVATALLPDGWGWASSPVLWWVLVGALTLVVVGLTAWQVRVSATSRSSIGSDGRVAGQQIVGSEVHGGAQLVHNVTGGAVIGHADQLTVIATPPRISTTASGAFPPPRCVANLPPPNPHFTGRTDLLAEMDQHLTTGSVTAIVAVSGLGGVGKSQVALKYAYQQLDRLKVAWWIPAERPEYIAAALAELAPHLGVPASGAELEATVAGVLAYLRGQTDWLLVFDNADNPDALRGYLPTTGHGRVIITSQDPAFSQLGYLLPVERLSEDEAVTYLHRRIGTQDESAVRELTRAVDGLPLALSQAASYIEQTGQSVVGYLTRYRRAYQQLLADHTFAPVDHPNPVAATWQLALERAAAQEPASVPLLQLCAFLPPEAIPLTDLVTAKPKILPDELAAAVVDGVRLDLAIRALTRAALLTPMRNGRVRVHRLVQDLARASLTKAQSAEWAERAVALAWAAFPPEAPERQNRQRQSHEQDPQRTSSGNPSLADEHEPWTAQPSSRTSQGVNANGSITDAITFTQKRGYVTFRWLSLTVVAGTFLLGAPALLGENPSQGEIAITWKAGVLWVWAAAPATLCLLIITEIPKTYSLILVSRVRDWL